VSRTIGVVTGARSDYGLLRPLLALLDADPTFDLRLFVTGMHLSPRFGMTVGEIEADGYSIAARIPLPLDDDTEAGVTRATAIAMAGFADALAESRPDLLVVLGDRNETFAAAAAALLTRIPIAHLHGGEVTAGAVDDSLRHAITKMSWLHFTAAEPYRRRVIQLGEDPARVFQVGALGVDNALALPKLSREQLAADLGPVFGEKTALVTFQPVTLEAGGGQRQFAALAAALERFGDLSVVITMPNADAGNHEIADAIETLRARRPERVHVFTSLGSVRYLSLLALADVCIGNSSSGLIEAPSLATPTVDIGDRQAGRERAPSVVHCDPVAEEIAAAIATALSPAMREVAARCENPNGDGHAAERIAVVLRRAVADVGELKKAFFDLPAACFPPETRS